MLLPNPSPAANSPPASPLISVVMPAYNASAFLAEAIASVIHQTFTDWELLIIDDGSTDETGAIATAFQQQDSRIRLLTQSNQGVSRARNQGIASARGELIAFLDSDDRWLPEALERHIQHFQNNPELGVSFARVRLIERGGRPTSVITPIKHSPLEASDCLYENPTVTASNLVVRRGVFQAAGNFDAAMSYSEDLEWLFRVLADTAWQVRGIPWVLVEYRLTGWGLSSELSNIEAGWNYLMQKARINHAALVNAHFALAQATHLRYLARQSLRLRVPAKTGVDLLNRAFQSSGKIVLRNPRRTVLVAIAVYGKFLIEKLTSLMQGWSYTTVGSITKSITKH
ncbi:MAG TPA: glycosyltransferase family 2 protein [Synechococcales cyanobacterium M55_K2018_004]|nr:glycosyltransferase family 2 protein [Synechococcales cyanobacterium M55_K2018_004]